MVYVLTDEGRKYLKEGLPEEQLMWSLTKPVTMEEAKGKVPNFSIALQWAKKNGWILVSSGEITLVKDPKSYPQEDALEKISSGEGAN